MFVHMDVKKPLIFIVCLLYYVATCVLGNPDAACRFRTARVSNRGDETVSCFEPRGSNDPVCRTGLKSSEGCCVYITNDQAWLKWDEKITLRCDSTHYGNSDGECASNQSSLDCDGEISANTTPGTDTPGTDTPGTDTPGTDTPGTDTPGTDTPGTDTPGTDTPGTDTPGTDTPGTDTPGTDTPGTDTPGTDTPGTDTPGTDTPGTDTPGTDTPGQQNTTQNGTPTARPRGRLFLLLPVSMAAVILLGTASYKHWKKLDSMSCCCP
ncbi:tumor necrosis factor receptor superfamily member 10C-like isoform X2 [Oncorhynchus masou masou]|uniref:tumor necrosis factor receptor superfamily member 10C-like isoform X2 n=1 Tax=Oncorhynchus masou masou TaxID=90313 RepID=UPI003182DF4C